MAVMARRPDGVLMTVALASALVLTACSGTGGSALPAYSGTSAASSGTSSGGTSAVTGSPDDQAVVAALNAYTTAVDTFAGGRALDMTALRKVAAEPFATQIGKNLVTTQGAGYKVLGKTVVTVKTATVTGGVASITACLDATSVYAVTATATSTAGAQPGEATTSTFTLTRASGAWLVSGVKAVGPCH